MKSTILSADLEDSAVLISTNTYADYFFIPASITVEVGSYTATLQTGLSYDHNDYSCPSSWLAIYDEGSDLILFKLDQADEADLDDADFITALNDECGTSYTSDQLSDLRTALIVITTIAQQSIKAAQDTAEAVLDADESIYVMYTEREEDDETGEKRACAEPELKVFDTQDAAEDYIDDVNQTLDVAWRISKETARSTFPENF